MVPPGIPGRCDTDFLPDVRPGRRARPARRGRLPGRRRLPGHVLLTDGGGFDDAIVADLQRELHVTVTSELMGADYFDRLPDDPPGCGR